MYNKQYKFKFQSYYVTDKLIDKKMEFLLPLKNLP